MLFNLLHSVERHTNHDQQRGSSELEGNIESLSDYRRDYTDRSEVNATAEGKPVEHAFNVVRGLASWANARDIAALLLDVVCDVIWFERQRSIEEREEDNHGDKDAVVDPRAAVERLLHPTHERKPTSKRGRK